MGNNDNYNLDSYAFDEGVIQERQEILNMLSYIKERYSSKKRLHLGSNIMLLGLPYVEKEYDDNGNLILKIESRISFKNKLPKISSSYMYYDNNGGLLDESQYEGSKLTSCKRYYKDGTLMEEYDVKDGQINYSEWRDSQRYIHCVYDEKTKINLSGKMLYKSGKLLFNYQSDGISYESLGFTEDNNPLFVFTNKNNGMLQAQIYHPNNVLWYSGFMKINQNGIPIPDGYGKEWDENGTFINKGQYSGTFVTNSPREQQLSKMILDYSNLNNKVDDMINSSSDLKSDLIDIKTDLSDIKGTQAIIIDNIEMLEKNINEFRIQCISELEKFKDNEEKQEQIISELSDRVANYSSKLMKSIERIDGFNSSYYEDNLKELFGKSWDKLNVESKQYLVTSEVVFHKLLNTEGEIDYSAACIPLTKAIEKEIYIHLYSEMETIITNDDRFKDDTHLIRDWNDYSLWKVRMVFYNQYRDILQRVLFKEFIRNSLDNPHNEEDFKKSVNDIRSKYRNKVAHRNGIPKSTALECRDYIVFGHKFLVKFMEWVK